jgi:hypothetical protein
MVITISQFHLSFGTLPFWPFLVPLPFWILYGSFCFFFGTSLFYNSYFHVGFAKAVCIPRSYSEAYSGSEKNASVNVVSEVVFLVGMFGMFWNLRS